MKHFVFDIDGTLIDSYHGEKSINKELVNALHSLQTNGNKIYVASGRCKSLVLGEILNFKFDGYFLSNGTYIIENNKVIKNLTFTLGDLNKVVNYAENNYGLYYLLTDNFIHTANKNDKIHDEVRKVWAIPDILNDDTPLSEISCNQIMYFSYNEDDIEKLKSIGCDFDYVKHDGYKSFDIMLKNINKGEMLKDYFVNNDVDLKDIVVFGDGNNDIEMFEMAGHRIAMGNACQTLKEVADYVTDNVDNDGVVKALKHFKYI